MSDTPQADNVVVLPVGRGATLESAPVERRRHWRARALVPIEPPLAFAVFLAGVLFVGVGNALEPAPADPQAGVPLWLLAIDTLVWAGVCVGGIGLVKFRTFGLWGAALAAGALIAESAACMVSGHHTFGVWWVGQLAAEAAFAGSVAMGWRINARSRPTTA